MITPDTPNPSDDFETLPGLPFTTDDMATIDRWYTTFRLAIMRLGVAGEHEASPDTLEISEPWQPPSLGWTVAETLGARWTAYRDTAGLVLADNLLDGSWQRLDTMDDVLRLIWDIAEEDRQAAIAAIPETLIPEVGL